MNGYEIVLAVVIGQAPLYVAMFRLYYKIGKIEGRLNGIHKTLNGD